MASRQRIAAAVTAYVLLDDDESSTNKKRRKGRIWIRDFHRDRETEGFFNTFMRKLRYGDPALFKNFVRMTASEFDNLVSIVTPFIKKNDTLMRQSISPAERMALTLRFLATGDSFQSLMLLFRIPVCTISNIIPEVCLAIYNVLKNDYLQTPSTESHWNNISKVFEEKWNFPNCIGALDGKHVVIRAPPHSGSDYFNYKKCYSIILMAMVDAQYRLTYVNVGSNGKNSDGGVFNHCSLSKMLEDGALNVPCDKPLPNGLANVPHVIVADDAFAMRNYLLKPYQQRMLQGPERIFNYRLSRARRVVENVFGIMSARFRVLRKPMELNPDKATKIVLAICVLHNYLMTKSLYATNRDFDSEIEGNISEGQWRREDNFLNGTSLLPLQENRQPTSCKAVREQFKNYFMTDGEVPWQYKHI